MEYVVVTLKTESGAKHDLELPIDIPLSILLPRLSEQEALQSMFEGTDPQGIVLYLSGSSESIQSEETLRDAGAAHGDFLLVSKGRRTQSGGTACSRAYLACDTGEVYHLEKDSSTVGRSTAGNQVEIDLSNHPKGKTVSRRHAQIALTQAGYVLSVLLEAKRATLLDGSRIAAGMPALLEDGMKLAFGDVVMTFHKAAPSTEEHGP